MPVRALKQREPSHSMTRFISSVAELTDLRDRDRLELSVATVLFELLGPRVLRIFRLEQCQDAFRLRERACIGLGARVATSNAFTEVCDLPRLADHPNLHACHEQSRTVSTTNEDGSLAYAFPVRSDIANVGLLELHCDKQLTVYQQRLIDGLLRIHRNFLRVLDAGLYDQLTGLLNRRTFDEHLLALLEAERVASGAIWLGTRDERRAVTQDAQSWLAVLDIDHFKRINDGFGHLYGDEVLVLLARLLGTLFREGDRIFRFGGEEFVVVLAKVPATSVVEVLERCRAAVESFAFPQVGRVTISIGYTAIRVDDSGSSAFGRADRALYKAKQMGRNQVQHFEALATDGQVQRSASSKRDVEFFGAEQLSVDANS